MSEMTATVVMMYSTWQLSVRGCVMSIGKQRTLFSDLRLHTYTGLFHYNNMHSTQTHMITIEMKIYTTIFI